MRTFTVALVALTLTGCFLEVKAGYAVVKQTSPTNDPTVRGQGVTIGFSIGTFIDPIKARTMVAVHYPFYDIQTNNSGRPVTRYSDGAWGLRLDHDISGYRKTLGLASKRRLTLAVQYGNDGRYDRDWDRNDPTTCTGPDVEAQGSTCMLPTKGSNQFKAYAGLTFQMGIPGETFGEGLGVSFGPSYAHWGGDGPAGHMDSVGFEVRFHTAVFWKMIGAPAKERDSFWAHYTAPERETPYPEPDQPKTPDHSTNPSCGERCAPVVPR